MDKQAEILASALQLFVELGFHGAPTSKIAKEAGVANGTLFHYYKTKDELIVALYLNIKQKMISCSDLELKGDETLKSKFKSVYTNTMHWGLENRNEFKYIQQFINSPYMSLIPIEIRQQMSKGFVGLIEQGIKMEIIKPMPIDFISVLISSHLFGVNQYLMNENFDSSQQTEIINNSFELIWKMII